MLREFTARYYQLNRTVAVSSGLHEYDGRLPDYSPEAIRAQTEWLEQMRRRTAAIGTADLGEREGLFRNRAFDDPEKARAEAVRATFDPGYVFYCLGKLMVLKLRDDWLASHPGASLREFHDAFLSYGTAPLRLVRKAMLGQADNGELFP